MASCRQVACFACAINRAGKSPTRRLNSASAVSRAIFLTFKILVMMYVPYAGDTRVYLEANAIIAATITKVVSGFAKNLAGMLRAMFLKVGFRRLILNS
jgi:hypothetical protein